MLNKFNAKIATGEILKYIQMAVGDMEDAAVDNKFNHTDFQRVKDFHKALGEYNICMELLMTLDWDAHTEILSDNKFTRHMDNLCELITHIETSLENKIGER